MTYVFSGMLNLTQSISQSQPWQVDDTFDLLTVDALLSQEPELHLTHATLRSLVLLCGTVYQRTFALRPFLCGLLPGD